MGSQEGFIYVLRNPFMPGLLKIGQTTRRPEDRARETRGTGIPGKFEVVYSFRVLDPVVSERKVHKALESYRVQGDREFFRMGLEDAIAAIIKLATPWTKEEELRQQAAGPNVDPTCDPPPNPPRHEEEMFALVVTDEMREMYDKFSREFWELARAAGKPLRRDEL